MWIRKRSAAKWSALVRLILIAAAIVTCDAGARAGGVVTGTVTDTTGGVLPGVDGHAPCTRRPATRFEP